MAEAESPKRKMRGQRGGLYAIAVSVVICGCFLVIYQTYYSNARMVSYATRSSNALAGINVVPCDLDELQNKLQNNSSDGPVMKIVRMVDTTGISSWDREHERMGEPIGPKMNDILKMMQQYDATACKEKDTLKGENAKEPDVKVCNDLLLENKRKDPNYQCWVFSFGIAYNFIFDLHMLNKGCEVRSYDPSMRPGNYKKGPKHEFYPIGIGINDGRETMAKSTLYNKRTGFPVKTLESLMKEEGIDHLDVVRLDTEGSEWRVLYDWFKKGLHKKVDQILVEVHRWSTGGTQESMLKLIHLAVRDSGMKLFWSMKNGFDPNRVMELAFVWPETYHSLRGYKVVEVVV